jgi:glycosyltransferase involved in cell wall biosynthesis
MKRVGMFWICPHRLRLDGEGIGRYCVRLVHGLLHEQEDAEVSVVTNPGNFDDIVRLFSVVRTAFPDRLEIVGDDQLSSVNRRIVVDMWIVPYIGLIDARHLEKPYVVCVHDLYWVHFPELRNQPQVAFLDAAAKHLVSKAAAVVFNSEYIRRCDGIDYLGLAPAKTCVILPAPPVEEYLSFGLRDEGEFRHQYGLPDDYIVYPSVIRPTKNHYRLVKAFFNFKQSEEGRRSPLSLVMTDRQKGPDGSGEIAAMEARCREVGIYFLDRLPSADMPSLYRYSRGAIVPTLFEGNCPFPILEALIMERPVAFSRIEVARERIAACDEFITFDPYCLEEVERAIRELCRADAGTAACQKAAAGDVLSRTWLDVAADYYTLSERLT